VFSQPSGLVEPHVLTVGERYCIRLPDGRALGHVYLERREDIWVEGPFTPTPAFEEYRALFEREAQLRHDQAISTWDEVADEIDALKIMVIADDDRTVLSGFRFFVEGNEAILGPPLSHE
jgi:hypothetical protein